LSAFVEALKRTSQILKRNQPFQVVTHGDVDGVAAGALAHTAFDCEVIIQKRLKLKNWTTLNLPCSWIWEVLS